VYRQAERSLDTASKDKGGDTGWVPRGSLEKEDEDAVFALEPGGLTVVTSSVGATYVYQVLEKAADHEIDPTQKSRLTQRAFQDWLTKKQEGLEVKTQVLEDRDKYQWARSRAYSVL